MNLPEILLIALGLSMDSFTVALSVGTAGPRYGGRDVFRLAFHFGLFQFLMPILGWSLGIWIAPAIASFDHWIAFALLLFVAIRMIRDGGHDLNSQLSNPTRGLMLLMLSTATSIDALAIGLGLAVLGITIWIPSLMIGLITSFVSIVGMTIGSRLGRSFGRSMRILGGALLVFIGVRIVISHMVS